jgi:hypothetical protein
MGRNRRCEVCRKRILIGCRADARFCSARCRQRDYRRRNAAAGKPTKAHQRLIRERLASLEPHRPACGDIRTAQVRPISLAEARSLILQYEWLGTMPAVSRYCFGIFFDGCLGGVVVYGPEYAENLGVWNRYGYDGKIIALLRGACAHWAHPNAASKLIRRSMDLLPEKYKVVTATVDAEAGEVGVVYQACSFEYAGCMRAGGRALICVNGRRISDRQAGRLTGTRGARALTALGFDAKPVSRRGRYFAFRGARSERKNLRAAIADRLQPYPKRAADSRLLTSPTSAL